MKLEFIPVGRIAGVHGIRGELRVLPLEEDADFLTGFRTFRLDGRDVPAEGCRVHKGMALLKLEGVEDRTAAESLRGKELLVRRADARLPEGGLHGPGHPGQKGVQGHGAQGEVLPVQDDEVQQLPAQGLQPPALIENIPGALPDLLL